MGFFLGGNLHAADDHQPLFTADLLGHLHLSCGVVVADGYDVEMQFLGLFHNG